MTDDELPANLPPAAASWVSWQLEVGEQVLGVQILPGGITAEMRKLTIGTRDGGVRHLVLRTYVEPYYLERAEDSLNREAGALSLLVDTDVVAPALVAVDPTGEECGQPSLLMTFLPGRTILDDRLVETRVPLLAGHLVTIHRLQPTVRPPRYETLTTPDSVIVPKCADRTLWAEAIDMIRKPVPAFDGRFLHRDFQPGNVLFEVSPRSPVDVRLVGVIDWAGTSWGPADLDVAHCCTNLALLHGASWGLRFVDAYQQAGGVLAANPSDRLFWLVRDCLAASEEVQQISRPWRQAGRTELSSDVVEHRLDSYLAGLLTALG